MSLTRAEIENVKSSGEVSTADRWWGLRVVRWEAHIAGDRVVADVHNGSEAEAQGILCW